MPVHRTTFSPTTQTTASKTKTILIGLTLEADPTTVVEHEAGLSHAHDRGTFDEPVPNP